MWEALLGSIRQMGVFMICAQALIYFKPKGSYEKYLKLLVSAMILVQLLGPVQALLSGSGGQSLEERIAFYTSSFEQGLGEVAMEEYQVEQIRQQLLTAQIRGQMESWDMGMESGWPDAGTGEQEFLEQDFREETGEVCIHIDPVIVGAPQSGTPDMGQGEEHGGEDKKPDGQMAEEG